jgi:hypothetical protein
LARQDAIQYSKQGGGEGNNNSSWQVFNSSVRSVSDLDFPAANQYSLKRPRGQDVSVPADSPRVVPTAPAIDHKVITDLKQGYFDRIAQPVALPSTKIPVSQLFSRRPVPNHPGVSSNGVSPRLPVNLALHHAGIGFASFRYILRRGGLPTLGTEEVFSIFDWNGDGTVLIC